MSMSADSFDSPAEWSLGFTISIVFHVSADVNTIYGNIFRELRDNTVAFIPRLVYHVRHGKQKTKAKGVLGRGYNQFQKPPGDSASKGVLRGSQRGQIDTVQGDEGSQRGRGAVGVQIRRIKRAGDICP